MYFHQTELFRDFSQETNIMQTGVCCRGTVKYWLGVTIYLRKNLLLGFKEQIRIIDTPELHEKTAF